MHERITTRGSSRLRNYYYQVLEFARQDAHNNARNETRSKSPYLHSYARSLRELLIVFAVALLAEANYHGSGLYFKQPLDLHVALCVFLCMNGSERRPFSCRTR